jgi:hypothetical protein
MVWFGSALIFSILLDLFNLHGLLYLPGIDSELEALIVRLAGLNTR